MEQLVDSADNLVMVLNHVMYVGNLNKKEKNF